MKRLKVEDGHWRDQLAFPNIHGNNSRFQNRHDAETFSKALFIFFVKARIKNKFV